MTVHLAPEAKRRSAEKIFIASLASRERERESPFSHARAKILRDKTARRFDGIAVNARNCGTVKRDLSCKSYVPLAVALQLR